MPLTETAADQAGAPHALTAADTLAALGVSAATGLTSEEAARRAAAHGPNLITARRRISLARIAVHQFHSPVVYLLGTAAALAFYFQELAEGVAIIIVLAVNALIGFATELKAARSIEALRALGTRATRVRRDGHTRLVPAEALVPGDIVIVEAGDAVSADLRLVEASNLAADESTLTGESIPVDKTTAPAPAEARITDRPSMLFKGSAVARGSGIGVVTAIGLASELGRITRLVEEAEPGSSPLERKLARLSEQLVWAVLGLAAFLAVFGALTQDNAFLVAESAIALAIAAIPEGLPIVATLALARGMWRMARQNALIERLSAVETLGATTVILTDKTGTLTENRMTVRRVWLPTGEVALGNGDGAPPDGASDPALRALLEVAVLCNDATLEPMGDPTGNGGSGDPMELALLRAGRRLGIERDAAVAAEPVLRKYAFDTDTRMMATIHRRDGQALVAVKGAPEAVLAAADRLPSGSGLDAAARADWQARIEALGRHGLRVLACASRIDAGAEAEPYRGLTFLGLIALEDPARADVPASIAACHAAGIRVVMVTGDHAVTARSIGRSVGLGDAADHAVEGRDLGRLAADRDALLRVGIFARVSPAEKLGLVRAYQEAGAVVAMTGDGVNDAPALRQADIGVAMGLRGTDVAREAASMVLLDDAFPTMVNAIREGRVIFGNLRRFVAYLLACNLSEVTVVSLAVLAVLPVPILPLQILYLNLVTDVLPAFALAMGEDDGDALQRPPRDPAEPILGRAQWVAIALQSLALSAATFGALALGHAWLGLADRALITVTFLTLAFAQLWHALNMRDPGSALLRNAVTRNPWLWWALAACGLLLVVPPYVPLLAEVLYLAPPTPAMWGLVIGMSLAPLVVVQAVTVVAHSLRRRSAAGDGSGAR